MIKEKVGQRIKELRTKQGLSQEEFAFKCELDRTYITSLERGKRNISLENLEKIAKAFNMSLSQFFDFEN
ncbi:MAG: helix-turn-helix transcriptional regulator [Clostridia bacterium]|nr:helix-turn-helix transcriptional regulator [Clostridia bacterium]